MAAFALDVFERQAEAFLAARQWRELQYLTGRRPGRGLISLYEEDFPDFTSTDLWADLQAATFETARQQNSLSALLASANLEGHTRDLAVRATRVEANTTVTFEETEINWRAAPARWRGVAEVARRHTLEETWRGVWRADLNPVLERWHETLRAALKPLAADDWQMFWSTLRGIDLSQLSRLAETVLETTADHYGHGLGIYLGQLDLPIDDAWRCDVDWAFRAPRFDAVFGEPSRTPVLIGALGDLGIELLEQTGIQLDYVPGAPLQLVPVHVPNEVHVVLGLGGGWQDYARSLRGLGMAEHVVATDPTLRFSERWLGDATPTAAYGLLLESIVRDKTWLASRLEYAASDDFRVIAHLTRLYELRQSAALVLYEQRLWGAEPGTAMAADFDESLSSATRVRHFPEPYLQVMWQAPWSTLASGVALRAEVFATQLRAYLRREFDEEWWRSPRAARFIRDELWRPGRRHTAEELLGFMGYEGFDAALLAAEFEEVLRPL